MQPGHGRFELSRFLLALLKGFCEKTSNLFEYIAIGSLIAMLAVVIIAVALRFFFNSPIGFGEELAAIFMYTIVFGLVAKIFTKDEHLRIDVLKGVLSPKAVEFTEMVITLIALAFMVIWTWFCAKLFIEVIDFNVRFLTMTSVPVWPVHLFIVAGMCLMIVSMLIHMLQLLLKKESKGV